MPKEKCFLRPTPAVQGGRRPTGSEIIHMRDHPASFDRLEPRKLLAAGDLIATFGDLGRFDLPAGSDDANIDGVFVAPRPDGGSYVGYTVTGSNFPFRGEELVARLTPQGQLDRTFSGDGIATPAELGLPRGYGAFAGQAVPTPDGGYLLLDFDLGGEFREGLIKVDANFRRVADFGTDGGYVPAGPNGSIYRFAALPNGDVVAAVKGESFERGTRLDLLSPDGDLRRSVEVAPAAGLPDSRLPVTGLGIDAQNRVYLAYHSDPTFDDVGPNPPPPSLGVVRFLPDLTLDASYGDGGTTTLRQPVSFDAQFAEFAVADDGRAAVLLTEEAFTTDPADPDLFLLDADGSVEVDREVPELRVDWLTFGPSAASVRFLDDGGLIARTTTFGRTTIGIEPVGGADFRDVSAIVRLDADGALDRSFGPDGRLIVADFVDSLSVSDDALTADGDLLLVGGQVRVDLTADGREVASSREGAVAFKVDLDGDDVAVPVAGFEALPVGRSARIETPEGLVFGSPIGDLLVQGVPQNYPGRVLQPADFGQRVLATAADGGTFDLASFDFAAARFGEAGDFTVTGTFADGGTRSVTRGFALRAFETLELDWFGLTSVSIDYAGGANAAYGALDDFVLYPDAAPPPPPAGRGIQFEDAAGSFYKYESGDFNVFARTPDGTGRGTLTVRAADTGNAVQPDLVDGYVRVTRDQDRPFYLESFDYQALVPSGGDAIVEGVFADGRVERVEIDYADDTFETLTVNWTDLVRVNIIAAGGDSPFAPVIDNLVVEPADPPTGVGITFDDAAVGSAFYKYESGDANVFARTADGTGRGELDLVDFGVGNGTSVRIDGDERVRITRDRDRPFDLRSIDLGQPLIGQGSAVVSVVYADGTTEARTLSVRNDGRLGRQALDIADAVRVDIFTTDGSPLVVDNVDLVRPSDPPLPPPPAAITFADATAGQEFYKYERSSYNVFARTPDGRGRSTLRVEAAGADNAVRHADDGGLIRVTRDRDQPFYLSSLDYASPGAGLAGDFVVTGEFLDGSVQTRTVNFSTTAFERLDLGWEEVVVVDIAAAGGVNGVAPRLDNLGINPEPGGFIYTFEDLDPGTYDTLYHGRFRGFAPDGSPSPLVVFDRPGGDRGNVLTVAAQGGLIEFDVPSIDGAPFLLGPGPSGAAGDAEIFQSRFNGDRRFTAAWDAGEFIDVFSNSTGNAVLGVSVDFAGGVNDLNGAIDNVDLRRR